jgi:hypothetical protein
MFPLRFNALPSLRASLTSCLRFKLQAALVAAMPR